MASARASDSVSLSNSDALRPITCVCRDARCPPPPSPFAPHRRIFPSLVTNEFIRARVYAGSVRMENLHGGMHGVQHGERSPDRANTPTLQNFGFLFAIPFCKPRVGALSTNGTLRYTKRGGGREGGEKRRNSLVGLSVSRASDFCFGIRHTRVHRNI